METLFNLAHEQLTVKGFIISTIYDHCTQSQYSLKCYNMDAFSELYNSIMRSMNEDIEVDSI